MPNRAATATVGCLLVLGSLVACGTDPPNRDQTVAVLRELCAEQLDALGKLDPPKDVFELGDTAYAAFRVVGEVDESFSAAGLEAINDQTVDRYVDAAVDAKEAIAALSRGASFEDYEALYVAIADAGRSMEKLGAAAAELGLPKRCGGRAWGATLFIDAAGVVVGEVEAMKPSGDYLTDLSTYCARYERAIGETVKPTDLNSNRSFAFAVGKAISLFAERLRPLKPPAEINTAHGELLIVLARAETTLAPSETLAVDGEADRLESVVKRTKRHLGDINALLLYLGVEC